MDTSHAASNSSSSSQRLMSATHDPATKSAPSKLFINIRRSLTPGRVSRPHGGEDGSRHARSRSRYLQEDDSATRPTIEQIAMGLHLSRTPHLPSHISPPPVSPYYQSPRAESMPSSIDRSSLLNRRHSYAHRLPASPVIAPRAAPPLPPPPSRSALKNPRSSTPSTSSPKASLQTLDSSSTLPSSIGPRTPSSGSSPARRFSRLSRFARGIVTGGGSRLRVTSQSASDVSVALSEPLRKSVRFEGAEDVQ